MRKGGDKRDHHAAARLAAAIHAKSPNYMIATDPNHYMPEDNTHFAEAIQLTIDAGLEKRARPTGGVWWG